MREKSKKRKSETTSKIGYAASPVPRTIHKVPRQAFAMSLADTQARLRSLCTLAAVTMRLSFFFSLQTSHIIMLKRHSFPKNMSLFGMKHSLPIIFPRYATGMTAWLVPLGCFGAIAGSEHYDDIRAAEPGTANSEMGIHPPDQMRARLSISRVQSVRIISSIASLAYR